ncbi:MAG: ATP-binding cassette domain-containing protein [Methanomassiliicoccus sp.]|nr:ATP-binding cassette domain-containing protein [Methanomassiliicoccus sp.]
MPAVVSARGLVKRYGDLVAVDHIDLQIDKGEVFGFLGPNGAGKSTAMHMIQGTSPLTAGRLEVLGMDITARAKEVKALIGVAPQENNLDPDFTVLRNLTSYARYFGIPPAQAKKRALELLDMMQLTEKKDTEIEHLSGGMKRRLIMARALINDPQLLILDEPTTGLDPQARHLIWEKIRDLRKRGTTIILTTHYMDEAEQLCDRLVIMEKGKFLLEGVPKELIEDQVGSCVMEVIDPHGQGIEDYLAATGGQVERSADRIYLYSRQCQTIQSEFKRRYPDVYSTVRPSTLEDVYLKLTGRRLKD